jgi:hypothetical protein
LQNEESKGRQLQERSARRQPTKPKQLPRSSLVKRRTRKPLGRSAFRPPTKPKQMSTSCKFRQPTSSSMHALRKQKH